MIVGSVGSPDGTGAIGGGHNSVDVIFVVGICGLDEVVVVIVVVVVVRVVIRGLRVGFLLIGLRVTTFALLSHSS